MNARQFLNSVISAGLERSPGVRNTFFLFPKFFFPEFLRSTRIRVPKKPLVFAITIYAIVFFLVFIVQATLAHWNGVLFIQDLSPRACLANDPRCLRYFLGDYANLLNYVVLVEAYVIAGCFFLVYENRIDDLFQQSVAGGQIDVSGYYSPSVLGGAFAILFAVSLVLLGIVGYAIEIQCYPQHWYMNIHVRNCDNASNIGELRTALVGPYSYAAHYYYVLLNFILLLFVAFVGTAHFGLFKTAASISKQLRAVYHSDNIETARVWLDEKLVKQWFAPFATQVLISKVFVLAIVLNMTSWKMWEPTAGIMNEISVIIMVLVGIWLVTMPRYFIQFHLFKIRQKYDAEIYKDLRMPWILGASAALDIILLGIAGKVLFDTESIFEFLSKILAA